jgi:CspA family cold shock protein
MQTGTVVWFKNERGFGFVKSDRDGQDYFCHYSQIIMPGYKRLDAGDEVQFDVEIGPKEKPQATRVTLVRKAQVA